MATNAAKNVKSKTKGPAGTASQRATKQGKIKGRKSAAGSKVKK